MLVVAASAPDKAKLVVRAHEERHLFEAGPAQPVLTAIRAVLRDGAGAIMAPDLVAERLEHPPMWLSAPSAEVLRSFPADLAELIRRADAHMLEQLVYRGKREMTESGTLSDELRAELRQMANRTDPTKRSRRRDAGFKAVAARRRLEPQLIHFGFKRLDRSIGWSFDDTPEVVYPGGCRMGDLIVVGAQTGVGKTTFSLEALLRGMWLFNAETGQHRSVIAYSHERPALDMADSVGLGRKGFGWYRPLDEAGYDVYLFDGHDFGKPSAEAVVAHAAEQVHAQVAAGRAEGLDKAQIVGGLPLAILVDYAKLFAGPGPLVQGIEHVAATLKSELCLGMAFDTAAYPELDGYQPVVWLPTQVKAPKALPKKDGEEWRPSLDDLADCRAIADYADFVLLLHAADEGDEAAPLVKVAKGRRSGRTDWIRLYRHRSRWGSDPDEVNQSLFLAPGGTAARYLDYHHRAQEVRRRRGPHK